MSSTSDTAIDDYRALSAAVFAHYGRGDYDAALRLIAEAPESLELWTSEIAHLEACLYGASGAPEFGLAALVTAHENGAWWAPRALLEDPDLAPVRDVAGFSDLLESSTEQWRAANTELDRSGDRLMLPRDIAPTGVLVALHGSDQDSHDAMNAWKIAVNSRLAVFAVRSSQLESPQTRTWNDIERAMDEIEMALGCLPPEIDELPIITAGFSSGGRAAMRWAFDYRPKPVVGCVAVGPSVTLADVPEWTHPVTKGHIVIGTEDPYAAAVEQVAQRLRPDGWTCETVPGGGHEFPGYFGDLLQLWLAEDVDG